MKKLIVISCLILLSAAPYAIGAGKIDIIEIKDTINPATYDYLYRNLKNAEAKNAECMILSLDTPGGAVDTTRLIVQAMLDAKIPVVVYVSPKGARAASAGTLITIAAHVAAMAPGTNIGAAHPVTAGGKMPDDMSKKAENDLAAFARSIATNKGRNADWAEKAVRESVSITETEALDNKIIDMICNDDQELLEKLDGMEVKLAKGTKVIHTKAAKIEYRRMQFKDKVLSIIANPNVAYILMMLGFYGIYFELSHPGTIFPGVIGVLCLILAFFAFQTLPISYAGLLLITLALILFIAELKVQSHGLLALGGMISLIIGSMMLIDSDKYGKGIDWYVIFGATGLTAILLLIVLTLVFKSQRRQPETAIAGIIGKRGVAKSDMPLDGKIFIDGSLWDAKSKEAIRKGDKVVVKSVDGLILNVIKDAEELK
ncbi:nodulation protein NfeD [bacterium]|nr:nodulation protein NfeD [bacterium]